jgi:hypothetical protein
MPSLHTALAVPRMLALMGALFAKQRVGGAHNPAPVTKSQTVLSLVLRNGLSDLSALAAGGPRQYTIDRMCAASGKMRSKEGWRMPSFNLKDHGHCHGSMLFINSNPVSCSANAQLIVSF